MNYLNVLAKALYDNVAESPDELSFRKGDIMTVLERNTQGLDGWWLCSLHGRQGIVPGNRLKILVGMYDKKQPSLVQGQQQALQSPLPGHQQGGYNMPSPSSQYTAMHPAYPALSDDVYLMPATSKGQQSLYPSPPGIVPPPKQHHHGSCQRQGPHQFQNQPQDIYQVPPSHSQGQDIYQVPPSSKSSPQDIYQVPPSVGPTQDIYQVPPSMTQPQDIYQVPPSMDKRSWEGLKPASKVVVPTRIGQVYVYDAHKPEQDEYDTPRHLLPPPGSQEIYDVPPTRGGVTNQYNQELYDTPPMAVKGPSAREHAQEIYDIPPSVEKNSQSQTHFQQTVYDIPPSVSKDVPDRSVREETYDIPPAFAKQKTYDPSRLHPQALLHAGLAQEEFHSDDVYDIPPPGGKVMDATIPQDIYDVPPSLKKPGGHTLYQDVYDVPREILGPSCGKTSTEDDTDYIYDIPPQVDRDVKVSEELANNFKRLSASSTGSTRSNLSTSSLDIIPVKESTTISPKTTGKELNLDLHVAMDMLAKLQHSVESSVSHLMSFINKSWRTPEQMEPNVQNIRTAVERVKNSVKDLLEFSRGAVNNAAQATDRTLYTKLSKQLQKMEEAYQILLKHNQALDSCNWAISVLIINKQNSSDDLDRIVMHSRGIPDDTKQLASFLHGNASLLFKRTKHQSVSGDSKRDSSQMGLESGSMVSNNNLQVYHTGSTDKSNIQSRPLPSPPKFTAADSPEDHYENNESGWMEDYDYVHLQGKEEFEKTQKELLEKGNIMRHGKGQLEQQQLKQFERLEEEVTRPIDNDLSNWKPPQPYAQVRSKLCSSDKQLLLFYSEQCEANITTLTNAIDAFFTSINTNQPPKIFVAHSKFVILSAHKLVFIGDTLSRQAKAQDIRNKVTHHSNLLCNMLKEIVITTKTAALQYPSVTAAKEMMDRVKELSNSMQQFKMALGQLAAM